MLSDARREYAAASARPRAALLVAEQGPPEAGEPRLTAEQGEELARLIIRADSFMDARTLLEDTPAEVLGHRDRWVMVDALAATAETAAGETHRYQEELGLRPE